MASLLLLSCGALVRAQAQDSLSGTEVVQGTLRDIRDKRRVLLVVTRSQVVDASDTGKAAIAEAYRADPRGNLRFRYTYNTIARKLNGYIKKYGSMTAVQQAANADFFVLFNLLEYRRSLGVYYPYGELYVIVNQPPGSAEQPRIVWKARKILWAEDAAGELIRDLKAARGEK